MLDSTIKIANAHFDRMGLTNLRAVKPTVTDHGSFKVEHNLEIAGEPAHFMLPDAPYGTTEILEHLPDDASIEDVAAVCMAFSIAKELYSEQVE